MPLIHPDERTIRIHPPIPWADIQNGPDLVALAMLFDIPEDADPLDPDERWQATGITTAGGADWSPSYLERQLQKVVDHYGDREYRGHIEVRSTNGEGTPAWRIVVRGKRVVRLSAVLGWPPEQADDSEDGLMEILAEHNVHIGDEWFIPADETDLPDVLLAWRDATTAGVLDSVTREAKCQPFPGAPGFLWRDADGDLWILGDDRRLHAVGCSLDPTEDAAIIGPMTPAGGES